MNELNMANAKQNTITQQIEFDQTCNIESYTHLRIMDTTLDWTWGSKADLTSQGGDSCEHIFIPNAS